MQKPINQTAQKGEVWFIAQNSLPRLSLRAGGQGFTQAIMNVTPGYFHNKIEPKELPKKIYIEQEITITKK